MQKHKNTNGMREQRSKPKLMIKIDSNPNIVHLSHEKGVDHVKRSKQTISHILLFNAN